MQCTGAALPMEDHPTVADYRAFGVLQTGMLDICEQRRALAVQRMQEHNAAQDQLAAKVGRKPWWKFWTP